MENILEITKKDVKQSWIDMVDHKLDGLFISRQASINSGVMTAEEADRIIIDVSKAKIAKYENMDDNLIHAKMLHEILGHIVVDLEEELND